MIRFQKRDRDFEMITKYGAKFIWREVVRKGRVYSVDGVEVELFTIKILSEAIGREQIQIKNWERRGQFPKPVFQVAGLRGTTRRFYSASQIMNLHRLYRYKYGGKGDSPKLRILGSFLEDVRKVFYSRDEVVDEQGEIHV